ncbi:ATP-dependent dethiobiotin synthetase BioD [Microcoleus sp. FACHB-1515]|uniref:dethiobiotin synthase n=1 Tax=Cyanophyceae TaxID=3028117 RepID=UPI0016840887|nr:dethiobiotin synthase [Microcoleus sp. FACHB-1515]MBD2091246.1 ATP-dependent dethiobiotin synthetase BioD [Microcoleus sp. FACHB-1515]
MNALLVASTAPQVGKTLLVSALAAYWQAYRSHRPLGIMKPIEAGGADRFHYQQLSDQPIDSISPIVLEANLDPAIAADRAGSRIHLEIVWQEFTKLSQARDFVLIEACGSLGSPVTKETTMADLAWDWRLPTVLVVPVQTGAIAQTVAHVALAQQARVNLKGIVLNCVEPCSAQMIEDFAAPNLLQSLTQKPILGCIPHLSNPQDLAKLQAIAANLEVERLILG